MIWISNGERDNYGDRLVISGISSSPDSFLFTWLLEAAWAEDWDTVDATNEVSLDVVTRLFLAVLIQQTGVSQQLMG